MKIENSKLSNEMRVHEFSADASQDLIEMKTIFYGNSLCIRAQICTYKKHWKLKLKIRQGGSQTTSVAWSRNIHF